MPRALRTHHVFRVSNRNCGGQALVRMEFPASGESPSSKAYIPPLPVFILGKKKKNVTGSGWDFFFPATHKEPANHHERHRSIRWSPGCPDPWLALETPPQHGVPPPLWGGGLLSFSAASLLYWAPFAKGEDLREKELGGPLLAFVTSQRLRDW